MHKSKLRQISLAVCFALLPFSASAAGLGKLTVTSGLGEPLIAEIELLLTSSDDLSSLSAAIAPDDAYAAQGIEPPALRNNIKVEVTKKSDGSPVIKLSTRQPVSDPFLDMLIQVDWSSGKLLREYTVLLDPPGYSADHSAGSNATLPAVKPTVTAQDTRTAEKVVKSAGSSRRLPASGEAASKKKPSGDYTTKRGDSLIGIARKTLVEDVNLEQMLVGIYRANKDAFVDENMNRLKAGEIIRIPKREEVSSISPGEASQEIRAQTSDWNSYRNKVAETATESTKSEETNNKQSSSGKIVAATVDKSAPVTAGPRDVVKLSKTDNTADKSSATDKKALQDRLNALQEESTAREKSVNEANERVASLEKQIADMKQLLAVKNQAMADLQKAAGAPTAPGKAEAQAPQPTQSQTTEKPVASATSDNAANDKKATVGNKPPMAKKITAPVPVEPPGLLDGLLDDPVMLGGAGGALVLIGGAWLYMRNKRKQNLDSFEQGILTSGGLKTDTVLGNPPGSTADANDTSFLTDFSPSTGGMIDTHDVDPIAEAEVYMAYGREAQAEEILKDAIAKEPRRYELHLKLLEILASRNDSSAFETIAGELYTTLGADDPTWAKVAEIGRKMEPDNPLYQMSASAAVVENRTENAAMAAEAVSEEITKPDLDFSPAPESAVSIAEAPEQPEHSASLDFDLGEQKAESEPMGLPDLDIGEPAPAVPDEPPQATNDLDFQLDFPEAVPESTEQPTSTDFGQTISELDSVQPEKSKSGPSAEMNTPTLPDKVETMGASLPEISFDLPEIAIESPAPAVAEQAEATEEIVFEPVAESSESDFNFDVNFNSLDTKEATVADAPAKMPELDLSGISLELDTPAAEEPSIAAAESPEVDTKLDLVTAYVDMGDNEGARELLDEVLKEGGPQQRERAQKILAGLG